MSLIPGLGECGRYRSRFCKYTTTAPGGLKCIFHKQLNPALLMIGLMLFASSSLAMGIADWPQWRGPNRDGLVSDASIPRTWPKELKQEWKVTVGVGHSSPVVANGRIYVFARQAEEEVLLCLDSATGKEIWRSSQPIAYEMHNAAKAHGKGPKSTPVLYERKRLHPRHYGRSLLPRYAHWES